MKRCFWPLLVWVLWLGVPVDCPAPLVFTPGEGWRYEPVGGGDASWKKVRASEQLAVARAAFEAGDYDLALSAAQRLRKTWPYSDYTPEAYYLVARSYEKKGRDEKAFKIYQELLVKHPKITNYNEILQRQYEIANKYFNGKWFRLWGFIPALPSMTRTIKLYEQVIDNGPYSPVAPEAQIKIAEAYEKKFLPDYAEAAKAYERAADRYSDQPIGVDALYQEGLTYQKQARTAEYDQSIAAKAIATFSDFITLHPQDPRVEEAQSNIDALRTEQARGSLDIARFYEKKRRWDAALIYYNEVLLKDPGSTYADIARQRIDTIQRRQTDQASLAQ